MAGPTGCGGVWEGNQCFPVLLEDGSWRCGGTKARGHRQLIGTVPILGCKPCDSVVRPSHYRELTAWNDAKNTAAAEAARKATNNMAAACGPCWQDTKGGYAAGSWQNTAAGGWQNKAAGGWNSIPWSNLRLDRDHAHLLERIENLEKGNQNHEQDRVVLLDRIECLEQGNEHHEQDLVVLLKRIEALEKLAGESMHRIVKSEKEIEANKKEIEANKQSLHNKPPGLPEPPEDFELLVTSDRDAVASTTGAPS